MSPAKIAMICGLLLAQVVALIVLTTSSSVQEWLFPPKKEGVDDFGLPDGPALNEFIQTITDSQRVKWYQHYSVASKAYDLVSKLHGRFAEELVQNCGPQYADELLQLAKADRQREEDPLTAGPESTMGEIYLAAVTTEVRIVELVREMRAMGAAMKEAEPPAPRLAVSQAQDVPPERPMLHSSQIEGEDLADRIAADPVGLVNDVIERDIFRQHSAEFKDWKKQTITGGDILDAIEVASRRIYEQAKKIDEQSLDDGAVAFLEDLFKHELANEGPRLEMWNMRLTTYNEGQFTPVLGRVVNTEQTPAGEWVSPDKWYMIGPWDNPRRSKSGASFLPETIIDLDTVAVGKGGRELRWDYLEYGQHKIEPPQKEEYGVWYFYTEMWFDEGGEYYAFFGADDYAKLWINGEFAAETDPEMTALNTEENALPLKFKPGLNKLLMRLENAGGAVAFGIIVNTTRTDGY